MFILNYEIDHRLLIYFKGLNIAREQIDYSFLSLKDVHPNFKKETPLFIALDLVTRFLRITKYSVQLLGYAGAG